MHNEDVSTGAVRPTLDRRSIVRGAAWAVPAVTVASAAPAFATTTPAGPGGPGDPGQNDFSWPFIINYAGWEWGNPSHDILGRGLMARTNAAGQPIAAGGLKITLNIHDNLKTGALCSNTEMRVKSGGMTYVSGLGGWGGDTAWSFRDASTGSGSNRTARWEFTRLNELAPGASVRLSFNADVDIVTASGGWSGCSLRITQTPHMTYSVSAPGYPVKTQALWHNNDVV